MKGYRVNYVDVAGKKQVTFFGEPISSFGGHFDGKKIIPLMFGQAHPGCKIVSISCCTLDEFEQLKNKN